MLVKNTVIALMAVAPALSIPVLPTAKSATVATAGIKAATAGIKASPAGIKAATARTGPGALVRAAELKLDGDIATQNRLRKELQQTDARLARDATSFSGLERAAMKTTGLSKTPGSKLSKSSSTTHHHHHHHSSHVRSKHPSTHKNKQHLRINTKTDVRMYKHSNSLGTPGSSSLTPGSTRKLTSFNTPGSVGASFSNALGTGRSQNVTPGPQANFQTPMTEDISYTPTSEGTVRNAISWRKPGSSQALARRALTPTAPTTPTTPVTPLSPLSELPQKHQTGKSAHVHRHSVAKTMKLAGLLAEAQKLVNGLEAQMDRPPTVFHNDRHKSSKHLKVHKTPVTPATPTTPTTPITPSA